MCLSSCSKDDVCVSNCGEIINDGITNGCYWLEIENECTRNAKTFCFDESVWLDAPVGSSFCVSNEVSW